MSRHAPSYLKTHRKRLGLSQRELAALLGCRSETLVSRYERLARKPSLEVAVACQVIFDAPLDEVFPGIYAPVEKAVLDRALRLAKALERDEESPLTEHKRRALRAIIARASRVR